MRIVAAAGVRCPTETETSRYGWHRNNSIGSNQHCRAGDRWIQFDSRRVHYEIVLSAVQCSVYSERVGTEVGSEYETERDPIKSAVPSNIVHPPSTIHLMMLLLATSHMPPIQLDATATCGASISHPPTQYLHSFYQHHCPSFVSAVPTSLMHLSAASLLCLLTVVVSLLLLPLYCDADAAFSSMRSSERVTAAAMHRWRQYQQHTHRTPGRPTAPPTSAASTGSNVNAAVADSATEVDTSLPPRCCWLGGGLCLLPG